MTRAYWNANGRPASRVLLLALLSIGITAPVFAEMKPGSVGSTFVEDFFEEFPNKALTERGKELVQRYVEERDQLADMDIRETAALPSGAKQCEVDASRYKALLGLDVNTETTVILQYLTGTPTNFKFAIENLKAYAMDQCPGDVGTGEVTFWVEYHQNTKKRAPEVETDIEAAKKEYRRKEFRKKMQLRFDGRFENGKPAGTFTFIEHTFPPEKFAKVLEERGGDPSMLEAYKYGYIDADGFDLENLVRIFESGSQDSSQLTVVLQQNLPNELGGLNSLMDVSDSDYIDGRVVDEWVVTMQWFRHDDQGRLNGWVHRKGPDQERVRKSCFIRNEPAPPEACAEL